MEVSLEVLFQIYFIAICIDFVSGIIAAAKGSHIRAGRAVRTTVDNFKGFMEIVN